MGEQKRKEPKAPRWDRAAFWERVKHARGNLNNAQLASAIGVSRSTVGRWEKGEASPDTEQLLALSGVTGQPVTFWFGQLQANKLAGPLFTPDEESLLRDIVRDGQLENAVRAVVKNWRFPDETT